MKRSSFGRLAKWATRQGENFLTESLLIVMHELADKEPDAFSSLLARLTGGFLAVPPAEAMTVCFKSQLITDVGRPDVEIRFRGRRVLLEVKDESPFGHRQIERYCELARNSPDGETILVLLTRYPIEHGLANMGPSDRVYRWIHISEWIEDEIRAEAIRTPVGLYLAKEFHRFLGERGLTMEKVAPTLVTGVLPLKNLLEMLSEALTRLGESRQMPSLEVGYGLGIYIRNKGLHVGIRFDQPELLQFRTAKNFPVVPDRARDLKIGEVYESEDRDWSGGNHRWRHTLNLSSANGGFCAMGKAEQFETIERFLSESLEAVRRIDSICSAGPASES